MNQTVRESFVLPLRVVRLEDGRYLGRSPRLPGLNVQGETIEAVVRLAPKVARALIAAMRSKGVPLPPRLTDTRPPIRVEVLVSA